MLPNGGFPPISYCEKKKIENNLNKKDKKGFFYRQDSILNIRDILKDNLKKKDEEINSNDDLDII